MIIETDTSYVQNEEIVYQQVEDELILLNPEIGRYFNLNGIAACIWPLLESPQTVDSIVHLMMEGLGAPEEQCTSDVVEFFRQMGTDGLIQAVNKAQNDRA